jgi:two-component system osmolarity sensor histidine kinase EnvZ
LQRVESDRAVILAGISHDLRTPLTRLQLEVEMAHLPDEARLGIESDIGQMDAIIGQFLDYAKPTDVATFSHVDISALLEDSSRTAMRRPDLRVTSAIAPHAQVMGNPTDLKRVINNLIENARRYGKTAGGDISDIEIACRLKGTPGKRLVIIDVCDNGDGVPPDQIDELLKPFTRMDTARGQANGAGLGLAIVQRVVQRHGAQLQVQNRDQGGLRIRITLPAA